MTSDSYQFCPYCGCPLSKPLSKSTRSTNRFDCHECGKKISQRRTARYEYKSRLNLFGWPLVHLVMGREPGSNQPEVARGLIAVGEIAIGGLAIGGIAVGGIALGGTGVGFVTLAGISLGLLFAFGGLSLSGCLAIGGIAVGSIAVGGLAVGYYALGGAAFAVHGFGGNARDPIAQQFFFTWNRQVKMLVGNFGPFIAFGILAPLITIPFLRSSNKPELLGMKNLAEEPVRSSSMGLLICVVLGGAFGVGVLWLLAMAISLTA